MYRTTTPYLFLAVPLVLLLAFFLLPFGMAFGISLMDYSQDIYTPTFAGLANYSRLLHSSVFWQSLTNAALFFLVVLPAMATIPMVMALLVNNKLPGIGVIRSLIYLPVIISLVVAGIAWKWLYAQDGLINYLISLLGFPKVGWLVNPDVALWAVAIVIIWKGLAYYMMMYLANLQSVSQELYEAADIDGAGLLKKHWHISLPHLAPTMTLVCIICTIGILKLFTEIYVMTRGGPVGATRSLVYTIYQYAFERLDLGFASAMGIVLMLILLVLSVIQLRISGMANAEEVR
ncbi:MAG: carbohydrate ABC transporter permease [Candidatus Melainabacteria bacterium]